MRVSSDDMVELSIILTHEMESGAVELIIVNHINHSLTQVLVLYNTIQKYQIE